MADLKAFIANLKQKKLLIPALAGGAILGGIVLIRNGGLGSSGQGGTATSNADDAIARAQQAVEQAAAQAASAGGNGASGGSTDSGAIAELQGQQQNFANSFVEALNKLASDVQNALNQQNSAVQGQLAGLQTAGSEDSGLSADSLNELFGGIQGAIASIPQQVQGYQSPQIPLMQGGLANSLTQLSQQAVQPIKSAPVKALGQVRSAGGINFAPRSVQPSIPAAKGRIVANPLSRFKPTATFKFPNTRGTVVPTYNSSSITSRGGFGGSKVTPVRTPVIKPRKK